VRPVNTKGKKVFSFLLGLVYGYRTADMELKVLPLSSFEPSLHREGNVFYLDRAGDIVSKNKPIENPTHVVVLTEDRASGKVRIYIYRGGDPKA